MNSIVFPTEATSNKDIQFFLKNLGLPSYFRTKTELLSKVNQLKDVIEFSWREDQKVVIESFIEQKYKYYVVNGIFGCGKTTMLLGIHITSILKYIYKPEDAMFISFNVSIKNELKQKLKKYGMSSKTKVRTFDSIIYEICKNYEYPYLDLPNYDGKRKFVYGICKQILSIEGFEVKNISNMPKFIFIDECQDLESQTMIIFKTFFSNCQVIFTGDVFQSIQKEPKESLLWSLLNYEEDNISKHYMKETPRIPQSILRNLKVSLQTYYPEFKDEIDEWKSSSTIDNTEIEWKTFNTYTNIFTGIDEFLETYEHQQCMILTFSSAITVKGAMGDLARVRRHLLGKGIELNKNYKKMDYDKLFLSTANSSKGLERDYILLVSTFPLERAFANFSNDLVMNLITVGITRAKKKVIFLVPSYIDKYSISLNNFSNCPKPTKERIRDDKLLHDFDFIDYYNMEHCVTEIIKQNIVKYDTRIKIREQTKQFETYKLFEKNIPTPKIETEEERAFVGVLIENLITSSWSSNWPLIDSIEKLRNHPMYFHCFKRIEKLFRTYQTFITRNIYNNENQFDGIYVYSQIHLGMFNKIFIDIPINSKERLKQYWNILKPQVLHIKPTDNIKIQSNMKMPFATGICDVMTTKKITNDKGQQVDEITIWELKASTEQDWKENALFQAILYALMSGKNWCRLILLNPFRNEKCSYYFKMKEIMELREYVINDLMSWNINCFLAKNIKSKGNTLRVTDNYMLCMKENAEKTKFKQIVLIHFISQSKIDIIMNMYIHDEIDKPRNKMSTLEKLYLDSKLTEEEALKKIYDYLHGPQCENTKIYYLGDCSIGNNEKFISVKSLLGEETDIDRGLNLENISNIDKNNAFIEAILGISYLGKHFKLQ